RVGREGEEGLGLHQLVDHRRVEVVVVEVVDDAGALVAQEPVVLEAGRSFHGGMVGPGAGPAENRASGRRGARLPLVTETLVGLRTACTSRGTSSRPPIRRVSGWDSPGGPARYRGLAASHLRGPARTVDLQL